jgi:hypothetical protein
MFSKNIPRWVVLMCALIAFCLIPPEALNGAPNLCLWRHLFNLSACPACGTTRALAALFHGQFAQALAFNRNVLLTAPGLIGFLVLDIIELTRRYFLKLNPALD